MLSLDKLIQSKVYTLSTKHQEPNSNNGNQSSLNSVKWMLFLSGLSPNAVTNGTFDS